MGSEAITLQGRDGLQFTASVGGGQGTLLSQVYADDASLYELIVIIPGEVALDDPRAAGFFGSFRFTVDE